MKIVIAGVSQKSISSGKTVENDQSLVDRKSFFNTF